MYDCKDVLDKLFDYLDKEMTDADMVEMKMHLELCKPCLNVAEFEKLLRDRLQQKTWHICPQTLKSKIQSIINKF